MDKKKRSWRNISAVVMAAALLGAAPGVATAASSLGSSGSSLGSSGSSTVQEFLSSTRQERQDKYLHEEVAARNIVTLLEQGHIRRLVELGYVEEVIMAGFVDELVEIGYYEPAIGIEESGVCPEVVVIAGRGSGQNFVLMPTRYSAEAPWVSNGREAETWRRFFHAAEQQYQLDHPGESLMKDVYVLGLDENLYPATHIRPKQDLSAAGSSAGDVIQETAAGFFDSVARGTDGVESVVEIVESSGCSPQYILAGYSQGAAALTRAEQPMAERGSLAGAMYMGNPLLAPNSPWLIGEGAVGGGLLQLREPSSDELAATDNRMEYCLRADLVCDLRVSTSSASAAYIMGAHLDYFTGVPGHHRDEVEVTRTFAEWVDAVRFG